MRYQIRIEGELGPEWAEWLGGSTVATEGDNVTLLTCTLADQAALHGLFKRLRDAGLSLLSMTSVDEAPEK